MPIHALVGRLVMQCGVCQRASDVYMISFLLQCLGNRVLPIVFWFSTCFTQASNPVNKLSLRKRWYLSPNDNSKNAKLPIILQKAQQHVHFTEGKLRNLKTSPTHRQCMRQMHTHVYSGVSFAFAKGVFILWVHKYFVKEFSVVFVHVKLQSKCGF